MMFNILIKREEGYFLAHCLELDIVATADTLKQVQDDVISLINAQIDYAFAHDNLDNLYHPAPAEVWKEFFKCKETWEKKSKIKSRFRDEIPKSFIPPWIIAKMCKAISCHT